MFADLIIKKSEGKELTLFDYYSVIETLIKKGITKSIQRLFIALDSFGMSKKEVLYLTLAMRDSGNVLHFEGTIFEKHSTGGIADSSSVVLIPLLASLGYKIIKTTAPSFVFTNGTADRFGAIPGFKTQLNEEEITKTMTKTNACVLAHGENICPADHLMFEIRENCGLESNINLLASSIACKKLASGANVVLVDVKYGQASIVKDFSSAKRLANLLTYIFKQCKVKSVIVISSTEQIIGSGVGNAVELVDAIQVLQGKKCLLRKMSIIFATEMIMKATKILNRKDVEDMLKLSLNSGSAYKQFLEIVESQGGDVEAIKTERYFFPKCSTNFVAEKDGYVGSINSLLLGELIRRLCKNNHDNNIGAVVRVKIGDYVHAGDVLLSFYYNNEQDLDRYKNAISGCIRLTSQKIKRAEIIKKVIN